MVQCFRCGSKLYIDADGDEEIIRCNLCIAIDRETGHLLVGKIGQPSKIYPMHDNSFWAYYWRHANFSDKWIHSAAGVVIHIDFYDGRYHVDIWDEKTELSVRLSESWKTLKTAKKWALVRGLNREWVKKALRERYGESLD